MAILTAGRMDGWARKAVKSSCIIAAPGDWIIICILWNRWIRLMTAGIGPRTVTFRPASRLI
ncbi:MAG: hypothetical protein MUP16_01640 [Sedimentisphaerales bacterium]|nr:hypothetical protein [Sedimentisphaerales bacterium]